MSLNNLGGDLSALGRREEALAAASEAADIYRRLSKARPDAFLPNLATSLNNTGAMLSALGRREEALAAASEAADIYRRLSKARPDAFLPDLALSLGALGQVHASANDHAAAVAAFAEGLKIVAPFLEHYPQAFEELARNLGREYIKACGEASQTPDEALLSRIASALPASGAAPDGAEAPLPDEFVRAIFESPQAQGLLKEVLRQNNIEGEPGDLPFELQRAIASALVAQGLIQHVRPDNGSRHRFLPSRRRDGRWRADESRSG
jgi:tetratricopeptide (TPR) repeat protein